MDRFWRLLAEAGRIEMERILSSDEEFDRWLKENPLSPEEQKESDAMVERLRARLLKTAKEFVDRDSKD